MPACKTRGEPGSGCPGAIPARHAMHRGPGSKLPPNLPGGAVLYRFRRA